jgi:hypothetical protein
MFRCTYVCQSGSVIIYHCILIDALISIGKIKYGIHTACDVWTWSGPMNRNRCAQMNYKYKPSLSVVASQS